MSNKLRIKFYRVCFRPLLFKLYSILSVGKSSYILLYYFYNFIVAACFSLAALSQINDLFFQRRLNSISALKLFFDQLKD